MLVADKVASSMATFWDPTTAADLMSTSRGDEAKLAPPSFLSEVLDADLDFLGKGK